MAIRFSSVQPRRCRWCLPSGRRRLTTSSHPSVPASSLEDFVAYARTHQGRLSYASAHAIGIAATAHFLQHARIQALHVPYKGESAALSDLLTGRVQALLPERSAVLPEVPTMKELSYPAVPVVSWAGVFGPANLPPDVQERLSREINAVLARRGLREEMDKRGFALRGSTPDQLRELVRAQLEAWRSAVAAGWIAQE
jgi:tripartite-type tricarboxylate transporter receptor subunit TctC